MNIKKILSWAVAVFWMIIIFHLSAQVAEQSNQLSTGITDILMSIIEKIAPNVNFDINTFNHIVRKNAHFIAYLILGILVLNALNIDKPYNYPNAIFALVICFAYAVSDEIHQLFVPGRAGQIKDVMIDSAGACFGIGLYWLVRKRLTPSSKNKRECGETR